VRVSVPSSANSYLLKIRFKRWGKLWSPGNVALRSPAQATKLEERDYRIGTALQKLPLPNLIRNTAVRKRYGYKRNSARLSKASSALPTCFFLECYNPEPRTIPLSLIMRATDSRANMPFQKLLAISRGYHRFRVPLAEITGFVDVRREFEIELIPNDDQDEALLYFGVMEFVVEKMSARRSVKNVKCVVWDLDHTLWDGILIEEGSDKLRLKSGIDSIIRSLDARGILNSVVSKNNPEEAWAVIRKFNLDQYFLFPQISWNPKSTGIQAIAKELNIGLDSVMFIDDSRFEREEVVSVCPDVRTLPANAYQTLLDRDEFDVVVTDESRERRSLYQLEMHRNAVAKKFDNDYFAFLRHCQIQLNVCSLTEENLERVHELTQRTNQMNFSGNRYRREVLRDLLENTDLDTFVLSCEDRFGSYGIIGFSIVDRRQPLMTDLMFSCRIQSKRIEHAFLNFLICKYISETGRDFYAKYRRTDRNAPSGKAFAEIGMEEVETVDGLSLLRFPAGREVPNEGVIEVAVDDSLMGQPA
jgi:FkbH-like protein